MASAHDSETLMQLTVARALQDLRLVGSEDAQELVLKELSSSPYMERVVASIRALTPDAVTELFAAATARLDALSMLARCDAELDLLGTAASDSSRFVELEEAATKLSVVLRGAATKRAYADAVAESARLLEAAPLHA